MAKMSFEDWKLYKEYEKYLADSSEEPKQEEPKKEEPKQEEPKQEEPKQDKEPENDYGKEISEIRKQLALMSKALSPSLNDIEPVGIDDVVKKFFTE